MVDITTHTQEIQNIALRSEILRKSMKHILTATTPPCGENSDRVGEKRFFGILNWLYAKDMEGKKPQGKIDFPCSPLHSKQLLKRQPSSELQQPSAACV
uniref:Uncharacterized protein n=1 Tax=Anopheles albimanus TaxID=7167 RepID=A0A182FXF9_ANOAL